MAHGREESEAYMPVSSLDTDKRSSWDDIDRMHARIRYGVLVGLVVQSRGDGICGWTREMLKPPK